MRTLVTGGMGFVGRTFVRRLVDDGHDVVAVDNLSSGILALDWRFKPMKGAYSFQSIDDDLRRYMTYIDASDYDLIIHCAAVVGGRLKIEGAPIAVATDLAIDSDFFQWIVKTDRKQKIVYFSSSAVYPVELQERYRRCSMSESLVNFNGRVGMPDQTYGWAKLTGELLARHAVVKHKKDIVIYRPFSGYGEDQDLAYPFPSIVQRVLKREDPITVWGSGDQLRDFIHIDDVVEGVLSTMNRLPPGDVLNLGTGVGISFRDLATLACGISGHLGKINNDPSKPEGVFSRIADTYKMDQYFQPKITLREGLERALDKALAAV